MVWGKRNAIGLLATLTVLFSTAGHCEAAQGSIEEVRLVAEEMCCKGCARKVSGRLYAVKGVNAVGVDLATHTLTVSLPTPNAQTLGRLWGAAEQGGGGPTQLTTADAVYSLRAIEQPEAAPEAQPGHRVYVTLNQLQGGDATTLVAHGIDSLKGVLCVGLDQQSHTLVVDTQPGASLSLWEIADAVLGAGGRPVAIRDAHQEVKIEWTADRPAKRHAVNKDYSKGAQR